MDSAMFKYEVSSTSVTMCAKMCVFLGLYMLAFDMEMFIMRL